MKAKHEGGISAWRVEGRREGISVGHVLILLLVASASPASAQHLGSRLQWQPQTMAADARLDQPITIEILGRAAVPALEMLSDATGVSLTVAPENVDTVGERKLTIISKGLSLKAVMIQLPEALQECHWDIDSSGDEPVYLLHRNGGADDMIAEMMDKKRRSRESSDAEWGPDYGEEDMPSAWEPPPEALLVPVALRLPGEPDLPALQRAIAIAAGFSTVSDFFEGAPRPTIPPGAYTEMPLWELLETLAHPADSTAPALSWAAAGDCLVWHHLDWYALAPKEIPESVLGQCREILREHGHFTLHDLVEIAIILQEKGLAAGHFPRDLRHAGIGGTLNQDTWAYVLRDSLSPTQLARAQTEEGLPFSDLTEDQQAWVLYEARSQPQYCRPGRAEDAVLRVHESPRKIGGRRYRHIEVEFESDGTSCVAVIVVSDESAG